MRELRVITFIFKQNFLFVFSFSKAKYLFRKQVTVFPSAPKIGGWSSVVSGGSQSNEKNKTYLGFRFLHKNLICIIPSSSFTLFNINGQIWSPMLPSRTSLKIRSATTSEKEIRQNSELAPDTTSRGTFRIRSGPSRKTRKFHTENLIASCYTSTRSKFPHYIAVTFGLSRRICHSES